MGNDGHSHYTDVLSILTHNGQCQALYRTVPLHPDMLLRQIAHTLLRLYPRTTTLTPSRAVKETYLNVQLSGFLQGSMKHLPPFGRKDFDIAGLDAILPDMAYESTVYASLLHRFQISLHTFYRDVVRNPIPVNSYTLVALGSLKLCVQRAYYRPASLYKGG